MDDSQLLRDYALNGSEEAFEALTRRHIDLVHSAALRQVRDHYLADEVTQAVFLILARKAAALPEKAVIVGWLYRATHFAAGHVLRAERRRQNLQTKAVQMETLISHPNTEDTWKEMAPILDDILNRLGEKDRNAILLRYFDEKSLREVGIQLGSSEEAAKKRVSRALEKLKALLAKRGVVLPLAVIGAALTSSSVQAVPSYLISSVTAMAAGGVAAKTSVIATMKGILEMILFSKIKVTAVIAGIAAVCFGSAFLVATAFAQTSRAPLTQKGKPLTDWEAADKCFVNLKKIGNAARVHANSHNDVFPSDFAAFKNYLDSPDLLSCPRDSKKPVMKDWSRFDARKVTYKLVTPGASVREHYKDYIACPIHSHRCLVDGSVQRGPKWQK